MCASCEAKLEGVSNDWTKVKALKNPNYETDFAAWHEKRRQNLILPLSFKRPKTPFKKVGTKPSTREQLTSHKSPLIGVPMGESPNVKYAMGLYGTKPIWSSNDCGWETCRDPEVCLHYYNNPGPTMANQLTRWYYLQWVEYQFDEMSPIREKVRKEREDLLFNLINFLSDYWLLACLGEARHGRNFAAECQWCWDIFNELHKLPSSNGRTYGAQGLWQIFNKTGDRFDALKWLLHVFCDHNWGGDDVRLGGPRWGWISYLALELNEAFTVGDERRMVLALDKLIFSHHCSGNLWSSRFEWSSYLIGRIGNLLAYKQEGKKCCWRDLWNPKAGIELLKGNLYIDLGEENCNCEKKPIEGLADPQTKFIQNLRLYKDICPTCDISMWNQICSNFCSTCKTCKIGKKEGKHRHQCGTCYYKYKDPDDATESCSSYCSLCEQCYPAGYVHYTCHTCKELGLVKDYTDAKHTHKLCNLCGYTTKCPNNNNICYLCTQKAEINKAQNEIAFNAIQVGVRPRVIPEACSKCKTVGPISGYRVMSGIRYFYCYLCLIKQYQQSRWRRRGVHIRKIKESKCPKSTSKPSTTNKTTPGSEKVPTNTINFTTDTQTSNSETVLLQPVTASGILKTETNSTLA